MKLAIGHFSIELVYVSMIFDFLDIAGGKRRIFQQFFIRSASGRLASRGSTESTFLVEIFLFFLAIYALQGKYCGYLHHFRFDKG